MSNNTQNLSILALEGIRKYFSNKDFRELQIKSETNEEAISKLLSTQYKTKGIGLLLGLLAGMFSFDRFYKGDTALGIVKLFLPVLLFLIVFGGTAQILPNEIAEVASILTAYVIYAWWFLDLFFVWRGISKDNYMKALKALSE